MKISPAIRCERNRGLFEQWKRMRWVYSVAAASTARSKNSRAEDGDVRVAVSVRYLRERTMLLLQCSQSFRDSRWVRANVGMSEAKRVPLQTLEFPESLGYAAKTEKKGEKGIQLAPSFRFVLTLPESNEKACPEFNYAQLLKAEEVSFTRLLVNPYIRKEKQKLTTLYPIRLARPKHPDGQGKHRLRYRFAYRTLTRNCKNSNGIDHFRVARNKGDSCAPLRRIVMSWLSREIQASRATTYTIFFYDLDARIWARLFFSRRAHRCCV